MTFKPMLHPRLGGSLKSWRHFGLLFSLMLCLTLMLPSCGLFQSRQLQPLKIGITSWPGFDIVLYAEEAGLFKKHGLTVEFDRFENQQDSSRAVMRGALDAAFSSLWDVVQVDPGNDKPEILLVTNISHGADGIVTQPAIKSVKDLKGKQVGAKLGTVNHLILLEALQLHGLKPEEVKIEDISNDEAVKMMESSKLDAAVIWQPLLGETAQKIKGNIVYTTKDLDSLVIDTLLSRSQTIKAKQAEFTEFLKVWLDVMNAVDKNPTQVFDAVGKRLKQSGKSFAGDYAGLKKGDIAMQQQMFQNQNRLKTVLQQMDQLLKADPRSGKIARKDVEVNSELMNAALKEWKP